MRLRLWAASQSGVGRPVESCIGWSNQFEIAQEGRGQGVYAWICNLKERPREVFGRLSLRAQGHQDRSALLLVLGEMFGFPELSQVASRPTVAPTRRVFGAMQETGLTFFLQPDLSLLSYWDRLVEYAK